MRAVLVGPPASPTNLSSTVAAGAILTAYVPLGPFTVVTAETSYAAIAGEKPYTLTTSKTSYLVAAGTS
jgi:hypothetical protein